MATEVDLRRHLRHTLDERRGLVVDCAVTLAGLVDGDDGCRTARFVGEGLRVDVPTLPADAVKIFFPAQPTGEAFRPVFDAHGRVDEVTTPAMFTRALTISSRDPVAGTIDLELRHRHDGAMRTWFDRARNGSAVWMFGLRTDFVAVPTAHRHVLFVDDSSSVAAQRILRSLPRESTAVVVTVGDVRTAISGARVDVITAPSTADAVDSARHHVPVDDHTQFWLGGEESAVRAIRRVLLDERDVDQDALFAAPYWSAGRTWEAVFDEQLDRTLAAARRGADIGDPVVLQRLSFDEGRADARERQGPEADASL
ncbi:siderophore-interacting protein [Gordonia soli]|uniref:Putative siderophore-interacting protein n=1 Tax=Gordonia soli NBRC 108243 TaxID=1223545 RepID=M0QEQ2_9ACTN|nr:siderophore-interacting protein [Gordonia soli]GAC66909.1 putative siderophore-interacting protein [Gordonia soli NBRC 108243]